jgi:hypothetical protein
MEDYAKLLISECDNTQSQILLVPPTVVAFIASACISKSEAGMRPVHAWKRGITKNKVCNLFEIKSQIQIQCILFSLLGHHIGSLSLQSL